MEIIIAQIVSNKNNIIITTIHLNCCVIMMFVISFYQLIVFKFLIISKTRLRKSRTILNIFN